MQFPIVLVEHVVPTSNFTKKYMWPKPIWCTEQTFKSHCRGMQINTSWFRFECVSPLLYLVHFSKFTVYWVDKVSCITLFVCCFDIPILLYCTGYAAKRIKWCVSNWTAGNTWLCSLYRWFSLQTELETPTVASRVPVCQNSDMKVGGDLPSHRWLRGRHHYRGVRKVPYRRRTVIYSVF